MTTPDSPQPQAYSVQVDRRTWFALAVLLAGAFIALLDTTLVNVALSPIRSSLGASESTLSWIISGYLSPSGWHSSPLAAWVTASATAGSSSSASVSSLSPASPAFSRKAAPTWCSRGWCKDSVVACPPRWHPGLRHHPGSD